MSETSEVAGRVIASTGQVVGDGKAYLDGQEYLLFSARVKGGSSGGPAIGRDGKVIGVVSMLPSSAAETPDPLLYGGLISASKLNELVGTSSQEAETTLVPFKITGENEFSTAD